MPILTRMVTALKYLISRNPPPVSNLPSSPVSVPAILIAQNQGPGVEVQLLDVEVLQGANLPEGSLIAVLIRQQSHYTSNTDGIAAIDRVKEPALHWRLSGNTFCKLLPDHL